MGSEEWIVVAHNQPLSIACIPGMAIRQVYDVRASRHLADQVGCRIEDDTLGLPPVTTSIRCR